MQQWSYTYFFQLHCYNAHLSMDVHCNLELKKKKKKKKIPNRIKIIFVPHYGSLYLLSSLCVSLSHLLSKLSQAHSLKLSPFYLIGGGGGCISRSTSVGGWVRQLRWVVGCGVVEQLLGYGGQISIIGLVGGLVGRSMCSQWWLGWVSWWWVWVLPGESDGCGQIHYCSMLVGDKVTFCSTKQLNALRIKMT